MSMPSSSELVATSARSSPRFERVFDLESLLARDRPVVRLHELLAGEVVELGREPLREPARVHEDQGAAVLTDQLEQLRVHVRPDARTAPRRRRRRPRAASSVAAHLAQILDGDDDLEVELLRGAGVDDRHGTRTVDRSPAEETGDLVERTLRRRQPDALRAVAS